MPDPAQQNVDRLEVLDPKSLTREMTDFWTQLIRSQQHLDSPYLTPQWVQAVDESQSLGKPSGIKVVVAYSNGGLAGFFPARCGPFTAMAVGAPVCDYEAPVSIPGLVWDPKAVVRALGVNRVDFGHLIEGSGTFDSFGKGEGRSWLVDLPEGYRAYADAKRADGHKFLQELEKQYRRLERDHGTVRFTAMSRSRSDLDQCLAWKSAQFALTRQTDVYDRPWTQRLLTRLFRSQDPDFGGALFSLHAGDKLVAAQFNLRSQSTMHAWIISHDRSFDKFSPGMLMIQSILKWMGDSPYRRYDLGPGDYKFKQQFATGTLTVRHGYVGVPSAATLVRETEYGVRALAERMPLGQYSQLPGKAMRRLDLLRAL